MSKTEIKVDRKDEISSYHLESIVGDMLQAGLRSLKDKRTYTVTVSEKAEGERKAKPTRTELVTADISVEVQVSDTLLEKAKAAAESV